MESFSEALGELESIFEEYGEDQIRTLDSGNLKDLLTIMAEAEIDEDPSNHQRKVKDRMFAIDYECCEYPGGFYDAIDQLVSAYNSWTKELLEQDS